MTIAFIGTGTMGRPMLANLVRKGFAVTAYDVVPGALDAAVKAGATAASSSAAAARGADLIVTMLPSSSHVESVYLGNGGVLEGAASGKLCVDMSTIDPAVSRRVAQALRLASSHGLGRKDFTSIYQFLKPSSEQAPV